MRKIGLYRFVLDKTCMQLIYCILNITSESCISTICVFYILRADKFLKKDIFGSLFFYIYSFSE